MGPDLPVAFITADAAYAVGNAVGYVGATLAVTFVLFRRWRR
jgi:hypothetical protein